MTRFHVAAAVAVGLTSGVLGVPSTGAAAEVLMLQRPSVDPGPAPQLVVPPLVPPLRSTPTPDAAPKFLMPQVSPLPLPPTVIVKCGMRILHGDAKIDPKILMGKQPPANDSKPVIGVKPAPACRE